MDGTLFLAATAEHRKSLEIENINRPKAAEFYRYDSDAIQRMLFDDSHKQTPTYRHNSEAIKPVLFDNSHKLAPSYRQDPDGPKVGSIKAENKTTPVAQKPQPLAQIPEQKQPVQERPKPFTLPQSHAPEVQQTSATTSSVPAKQPDADRAAQSTKEWENAAAIIKKYFPLIDVRHEGVIDHQELVNFSHETKDPVASRAAINFAYHDSQVATISTPFRDPISGGDIHVDKPSPGDRSATLKGISVQDLDIIETMSTPTTIEKELTALRADARSKMQTELEYAGVGAAIAVGCLFLPDLTISKFLAVIGARLALRHSFYAYQYYRHSDTDALRQALVDRKHMLESWKYQ